MQNVNKKNLWMQNRKCLNGELGGGTVVDLRGGARDVPPLWPKISSFSCIFWGKLAK